MVSIRMFWTPPKYVRVSAIRTRITDGPIPNQNDFAITREVH